MGQRTKLCRCEVSDESVAVAHIRNAGEKNDGSGCAEIRIASVAVRLAFALATKLVVLKMIYGAIFYVLLQKTWQFMLWFIKFLKEKHEKAPTYHIENSPYPGSHDDHGPYPDSFPPHSYGPPGYHYENNMYDADGSYAVKT
ncbi:hypothetical protein EVAR_66238_1 [Eumeta japonica]|uniref:Uncharacterized protein n=1 Tax=Eumeta variegata TaxID=151549 RepID=A0A4C1ZWA6_EUMVA|nr:hypothetical protein EVAR_66238_1 [Eumeta japonica]